MCDNYLKPAVNSQMECNAWGTFPFILTFDMGQMYKIK